MRSSNISYSSYHFSVLCPLGNLKYHTAGTLSQICHPCNSAAQGIRKECFRLASLLTVSCYRHHVLCCPVGIMLSPAITSTAAYLPQYSNGAGCDLNIVVDQRERKGHNGKVLPLSNPWCSMLCVFISFPYQHCVTFCFPGISHRFRVRFWNPATSS